MRELVTDVALSALFCSVGAFSLGILAWAATYVSLFFGEWRNGGNEEEACECCYESDPHWLYDDEEDEEG